MSSIVLHQASWVVPVSSPEISNGCVVTKDDTIIESGTFTALRNKYPHATLNDHGNCALTPALINTHIHLELSHLHIPEYRETVSGFIDWIETLLSMREKHGSIGKEAEEAVKETLQQQHRLGVIALGDIGNTNLGYKHNNEFPGLLFHFNECLGRSAKTRKSILKRALASSSDKYFTAHAPYSTHPDLIKGLKQRAIRHKHPFPIHVAEPASENELLCCGTGELYTFLKERGFIEGSYHPPAGIDNHGSVQYLHKLGVLDKQTICVHCIHVTPEEVKILADSETKVCLCPGSNRYLRVGKAPVDLFLKYGLLPALGTDSQASNPKLSLWREMRILSEDNPNIDPAVFFSMATLGGAKTLGIDSKYGTLEPGRSVRFLAIPIAADVSNRSSLYEYLVQHEKIQPTWVNEQ